MVGLAFWMPLFFYNNKKAPMIVYNLGFHIKIIKTLNMMNENTKKIQDSDSSDSRLKELASAPIGRILWKYVSGSPPLPCRNPG